MDPVQTKLKGMPKRDKVGRLAKKYIKSKETLAEAKEASTDAGVALVKGMRETDRSEIKIEGMTITLRHVESQDILKVKKPKE